MVKFLLNYKNKNYEAENSFKNIWLEIITSERNKKLMCGYFCNKLLLIIIKIMKVKDLYDIMLLLYVHGNIYI